MILSSMKHLSGKRIILASSSPRRKTILESIGLHVEIIPSTFAEDIPREKYPLVQDYAIATAKEKALEIAQKVKECQGEIPELIIAADTIVSMDGEMFGKPHTKSVAHEMLSRLSGRCHEVYTGVVLLWNGFHGAEIERKETDVDTFYEMTKVKMAKMTEETISAYIETGEPMDKAGSYGIQGVGGSLVQSIEGDYFNVMGLPMYHFCQVLSSHYRENLN